MSTCSPSKATTPPSITLASKQLDSISMRIPPVAWCEGILLVTGGPVVVLHCFLCGLFSSTCDNPLWQRFPSLYCKSLLAKTARAPGIPPDQFLASVTGESLKAKLLTTTTKKDRNFPAVERTLKLGICVITRKACALHRVFYGYIFLA